MVHEHAPETIAKLRLTLPHKWFELCWSFGG